MSGGYTYGPDECGGWLVRRPVGSAVARGLRREAIAELICVELNRLSSRPGSPEGWPEGADAEGAELVRADDMNGDDMEAWVSNAWAPAGFYSKAWDELPRGALVVARRKPKPVTRDVRADKVRGVVRLGSDDPEEGPLTLRPSVVYVGDDGATVTDVSFVRRLNDGWVDYATLPASTVLAVLVEDPNG